MFNFFKEIINSSPKPEKSFKEKVEELIKSSDTQLKKLREELKDVNLSYQIEFIHSVEEIRITEEKITVVKAVIEVLHGNMSRQEFAGVIRENPRYSAGLFYNPVVNLVAKLHPLERELNDLYLSKQANLPKNAMKN